MADQNRHRRNAPQQPSNDPASSQTTNLKTKTASPNRIPIFEYPALPHLEIIFYFVVVIITIIYAWYRIFLASRAYKWNSYGIWESYEDVKWAPNGQLFRKDTSNTEWRWWSIYARKVLPWLVGHALMFNVTELILPKQVWKLLVLSYWVAAHVIVTNRLIIGVAVILGITIYCLAHLTRSKVLTWLVAVAFLYLGTATDLFVTYDIDGYGYYVVMIVLPYKTVHYLTFITEMITARQKPASGKREGNDDSPASSEWPHSFVAGLYEMFWYAFYLPYACHMIVTYQRFPGQLAERSSIKRDWYQIAIFGLRILFWYVLADALLYAFYFEAMMYNSEYLKSVPEDTLVSIGYATGQFFHLKYVVIFGLTAFFARIDKMQPFDGPICISRLVLYSKVWRCFDRGLYDFFKEYIFLPICRPTFSIHRKIFGVFVSYAFVLLWHGTEHQYVVWIILNISELFVEIFAKILYTIPALRSLREKHISDRNMRRLLAWLQIIPFAFGLYSNFYFLGSSESGYVFVERIFWQETVPVKWPFLLLISLGYCYSHVCMEVDRWQSRNAKATRASDKKKDD